MFSVENQWCVIEVDDQKTLPVVYGPFARKSEAIAFMNEFNEEYDGSPYHAIMRPLMKMIFEKAVKT